MQKAQANKSKRVRVALTTASLLRGTCHLSSTPEAKTSLVQLVAEQSRVHIVNFGPGGKGGAGMGLDGRHYTRERDYAGGWIREKWQDGGLEMWTQSTMRWEAAMF